MPTYPDLLAYVRQFVTMPPESWRAAEAKFRPRHLRPGQWLLPPGGECSQIGFLRRGKLHFFTPEGDMDRSLFQLEGPAFFPNPEDLLNDQASPYGIEALSEVELVLFSSTDWRMLTELCMPWQRFRGRILNDLPSATRLPKATAKQSGVAFNASMAAASLSKQPEASHPSPPEFNDSMPSL